MTEMKELIRTIGQQYRVYLRFALIVVFAVVSIYALWWALWWCLLGRGPATVAEQQAFIQVRGSLIGAAIFLIGFYFIAGYFQDMYRGPQHLVILVRHASRERRWRLPESEHWMKDWSKQGKVYFPEGSDLNTEGLGRTAALAGHLCDELKILAGEQHKPITSRTSSTASTL